MTEQELRALVRQAIARHAGALSPIALDARGVDPAAMHMHTSHAMCVVPSGADMDGPCLIEPTVMCNHCGYCQSLGH